MNDIKIGGLSPPDFCSYLGINQNLGVFEIFNYFFDGKVTKDEDMIICLENAFCNESDYCFCLKLGVSFCWFTISDRGIRIRGKLQFSELPSYYTIGKFIKRLRYHISMSGFNLNSVKYMVWSKDDIEPFSNYILDCICLEDFFSNIENCRGLSCMELMQLLSKTRYSRGRGLNFNAETFVNCLMDSYSVLGIKQENGSLRSNSVFYKDYSSCSYSSVDKIDWSYGFILDTEGVKGSNGDLANGISELGGIIYCRHKDIILSVKTFTCDRLLLNETMKQAIKDIKDLSSDIGHINTLVYGKSDSKLLYHSLSSKIYKQLHFIDVKPIILRAYPSKVTIQSKLAENLGVSYIKPKHNPLSDARTLFNIVAKYVLDYPERRLDL